MSASDSNIGVALVGFGLAGRYFHAPLLVAAGFSIRVVVTSRAQEVAAVLSDANVCSTLDEALARPDVRLVVIATPNRLHFEQAGAALRAGKHVVVDKPLSITSAEARHLTHLARQVGRVISVFHNRRWDADFLTLRALLASDRLGDLRSWHARWDRYRPQVAERWRERDIVGGGVLYDLGSHLIDQVLTLFGAPEWLQADVFAQRDGATAADGFELLMAQGPLRMTLGVNSIAAASPYRFVVHGMRASFWKRGIDPQEAQLRAGMSVRDAQFGCEPASEQGVIVDGSSSPPLPHPSERGCWLTYYEQMMAAVAYGGPVPVSAHDGARVLEIIEAASESSRTGQRIHL